MNNNYKKTMVLGLSLAGVGIGVGAPRESMHDVPINVTAFSGLDAIKRDTLKAATLRELTPLIAPQVIPTNSISLRGIGNTGGTLETATNPQLFLPNLNRIEVLRGPQGTLYGKNKFAGVVSIGHTENSTHDPVSDHSSGYIRLGIGYQDSFDLGSGKLDIGLSAMVSRYDNAFDYRTGDDRYLYDFGLYADYQKEISPSAELEIDLTLNHVDHGTIPRGFNWAGPLQSSVLDYGVDTNLTWRTDQQDLTAPGLVHRTGLSFGGYDEKDGDFADSFSYRISHEFIYLQKSDSGLYLRLEAGERQFKEMTDYDSTRIGGTFGFFTPLPCGAELRLGIGAEDRDYEGDDLNDATEPTAEALISGDIGRGRFSFGAEYRSFENFANWGGGSGVDMRGLQIGTRVTHPITDSLSIRFSLESSYLEADSSDDADESLSFQRGSIALGYKYKENIDIDLVTALNRASVDGSGGYNNNDTYLTWALNVRHDF